MILNQISISNLSQQTSVILSLSKDKDLFQDNLQNITPVFLSSSKDGILIEDNLQRIPSHFDKLSVTLEQERLKC